MNNWRLVRLDFGNSPVHFGDVGFGMEDIRERVHSDTLFSAWINAYALLFGLQKVENLLAQFIDAAEPPIKISSTFIYNQQDKKATYYLPCPLQSPPNYPEDDLSFFPLYQKLPYLPLSLWQRWYQKRGFTLEDYRNLTNLSLDSQTGSELEQAFQYRLNYSTNQVAKIALDRTHNNMKSYSTGFTQFLSAENHYSGLYFLVNFTHQVQDLEYCLQAALDLLGEEGLGGERSNGAGRFRASWQSLPSIWQEVINFQQGTHYCLLSFFWQPSLAQEFLQGSRYQLIERGGWVYSPFSRQQIRRQKVHMFTEGSIFTTLPSGQLADVTPLEFRTSASSSLSKYQPHPIFRNGISLTIPIYLQPEHD